MVTHAPHDSEYDDTVLYDLCERCYQQAQHPAHTLDHRRFLRLWDRMVAVETAEPDDPQAFYRSSTEALGAAKLYEAAVTMNKLTGLGVREIDLIVQADR